MLDHKRSEVSNILVIGSGGAGLRAAIAAHEANAEVTVIGKRLKKDAHTVLAAGGINGALGTVDPEDTWQQHFVDTMKEGYFLADPKAVEILSKNAPDAIKELDEWGCPFAKKDNGKLDQRYFGAHKYRRTCYAGDWTGRAILYTLVDKVEELGIPIIEHQYVWSLLHHEGQCFGAIAFDMQSGEITVYQADAVILAAGGHTRLWKKSSSRKGENTGDGMYLALQAGAEVADMELVQFHPTGMTHPNEWVGTLVTEAVRGEGGRLYNSDGKRFMEDYDPDRMELSTRDKVALANYAEIMAGRCGPNNGVFLDVSHLEKEEILKQLPRMYRQFIEAQNIDISKDPMEVSPTAHYSMGGVVVKPDTHETKIKGLFAVGEATSGVHGANRLGGNSLAETVVFGKIAGEEAAKMSRTLTKQLRSPEAVEKAINNLKSEVHEGENFVRPLQRELREAMWENCGVLRTKDKIEEGLKKLKEIENKAKDLDVRPTAVGYEDLANALDLKASLLTAKVTLLGALAREESRGAHQREDFTETKEEFQINIRYSLKGERLEEKKVDVEPVPDALKEEFKGEDDEEIEGKLLE